MRSLLFVPSLARRVFLAVVIAFVLVGVGLTAKAAWQYFESLRAPNGDISAMGETLMSTLSAVTTCAEATTALRAIEDQINMQIVKSAEVAPGDADRVLVRLWDASGAMCYVSHPDVLPDPAGRASVERMRLAGNDYWVYPFTSARWQLQFGMPGLSPVRLVFAILKTLVPELLLAFPLALLPIWIAVRRGLQPLSVLSQRLLARHEDDLAPLAMSMDYAELAQVTHALERLLERLRRKLEHERSFIQDAAHELRTPMAVIAAQAHLLARATSDEVRVQAESALRDAIRRASHLSEQLLSLASLDQERHGVLSDTDLVLELQNVLAECAPAALRRQMDLALEAPESLRFPVNRPAFLSIVQNLVDNATRYGRDGGRIVVGLSGDNAGVCLRVADDGPGIPAEERTMVFDRFYRGRAHDTQGTGLGLAIVAKAVWRMGGQVSVGDGLDGRGVTFVVTFRR